MKIAIAGAGVAGSYIGCLLNKRGQDVQLFEWSKLENHWPICAWAIPKGVLLKFCKHAGLDIDDYLLFEGNSVKMRHLNNNTENVTIKGLITFNREKWEKNLRKDLKVIYDKRCNTIDFPFEDYDYVIDCTGVHRSLLPKSNEDFLIPTYEYLVENVHDIDEF